MTDEADTALDEKRVHGDRRGATRAVVASGLGLATVQVSDDQIGRFGLAHRCVARDVASDGRLGVATDDHVLVGNVDVIEATQFGPAVAVGFATTVPPPSEEGLVAAGPDGRVARRSGDAWAEVGEVDAPVRGIDGDLLASADGVFRVGEGLDALGLDDVRDVAADGTYAATADGIHRRSADGWITERDGDATVVASDGERAHAVVDGTLLERMDGTGDGPSWADADCPEDDVVAVAYADATYAVTADGRFLVDATTAKDGAAGWRSRSLGLDDVAALAVV